VVRDLGFLFGGTAWASQADRSMLFKILSLKNFKSLSKYIT
jgi:hypothetical protein